jgi:hypothetical protein
VPKFRDAIVPEVNGKPTNYTYPVEAMTRASYDNELLVEQKSRHLGYAEFLKNRKLDALKLALARNASPKAEKFLKLLVNPKYRDADIADLAEKCGIGFGELMAVWRSDRLTEAMANLVDAAPVVAEHTALDAQSTQVCCSRCDGAGVMQINNRGEKEWVQCTTCVGTGYVRKIGDRASRQFMFEATGIVKASAGLNVTVNTGAASSVESVLDEMERATNPYIDVTAETPVEP